MNLTLVENSEDQTVTANVSWVDGQSVSCGTKSAKAYVDSLTNKAEPVIGLLPPAVRYISPDKRIVVFERPPGYHKVSYFECDQASVAEQRSSNERHFVLPMPWMVYVVGFGLDCTPVAVRVYMRREELHSLDDHLGLFPMLNFYTDSRLCNPNFAVYEEQRPTIADGLQAAYNAVWNSGFNYDLTDAVKWGYNAGSPVTIVLHHLKKSNPLYALGLAGDHVSRLFTCWSRASIPDVLQGPLVCPGTGDTYQDEVEEEDEEGPDDPHATYSLSQAISQITSELISTQMGSANVAKNFMTTLVNNFNVC